MPKKDRNVVHKVSKANDGTTKPVTREQTTNSHGPKSLKQQLNELKQENQSLRTKIKEAKLSMPNLVVGEDNMSLVYKGVIAGKPATRREPIVEMEDVRILQPILTPVVSVLNAALNMQSLEEKPYMDSSTKKPYEIDGKTVFKGSALAKAKYAYSSLLENPDFIKQMIKLNEIIDRTFTNKGVMPGELKTFTKASTGDGVAYDNLNRLQIIANKVNASDTTVMNQSIDKDITD